MLFRRRCACIPTGSYLQHTLTAPHPLDRLTGIARIFNTYGPRMQFHDGRVVSNFVVQAPPASGKSLRRRGEKRGAQGSIFVPLNA